MVTKTETLKEILHQLKRSDGDKWIKILGQYHPQYNEVPIWVLVKNEGQIASAIVYLQDKLKPLQAGSDDVTVSFISYDGDLEYSYGMFKGKEFFLPGAHDDLYEEPFINPRTQSLFDLEYPTEPWAIRS